MEHIVQSDVWGKFKTKMGTPAVRVGDIQYTKHKIPFTRYYFGYSPKVNPAKINWSELRKSLDKNSCISINFDVPNIIKGTQEAKIKEQIFKEKCKKSKRDTFAKANVLLDISDSEEKILANMHKKHRYNIKYAQKKGVKTRLGSNSKDLDIFYNLLEKTAKREGFYIHSKKYFKNLWEILSQKNSAHLMIAEYENEPLTAWMLFTHNGVLYYPYGGSTTKKRNLQHSMAVAWASIKLGKEKNCHTFDMWGAATDPKNKKDDWYGFTKYKLKFGGKHVEYIDSYDFAVNKTMHSLFSIANNIRWKILKAIK